LNRWGRVGIAWRVGVGIGVGLEDERLGFEGRLNSLWGFEEGRDIIGCEDEDGRGGGGGSG
jgi:hypothetical protein